MFKSNLHKKIGQSGWSEEEHTSRTKEESFGEEFSLEKPSTGKKKSKRKPPKKCKHKHNYVDVICVYRNDIFGKPCKHAVLRRRCTICGKLEGWIHPSIKDPISCGTRMMTYEEILRIYADLQVIKYD